MTNERTGSGGEAQDAGPDLSVDYLGMRLSGPIVASASPLTRTPASMRALEAAGASAVVLPSLFAEEAEAEELALMDLADLGDGFAEFDSAPLADVDTSGLGVDAHVRLVSEAKAALAIPVIASVNGHRPGGWARYAHLMADAGADAMELNLYAVNADPSIGAGELEARSLRVIAEVKAAVDIPLAVKLSTDYLSLAHFAVAARDAGADGLVLFNRFLGPDIDLDDLTVVPRVELSTPQELRVRLRWIAIVRDVLPQLSLAATGGVHSAHDVIKALLVGANVTMLASALLHHGPAQIDRLLADVRAWLAAHDYDSVRQLTGSMSAGAVPNPGDFERAQYVRAITSYSTPT